MSGKKGKRGKRKRARFLKSSFRISSRSEGWGRGKENGGENNREKERKKKKERPHCPLLPHARPGGKKKFPEEVRGERGEGGRRTLPIIFVAKGGRPHPFLLI